MTDETNTTDARQCRAGLGRKARMGMAAAGLIAIGAALGGLATVSVTAGAHGFGGGRSAEAMSERMRDKAAWMLGKVDATEEQEQQVDAIITALAGQMQPIREQHRANRRAFVSELSRSSVDAGRLEALRQDGLRLADQASARILDAVVQASVVLTPEQRAELTEHMMQRRHRH